MQPQYIGNNDYRGYLNYLSTNQGNKVAGNLLNYGVGNDAGFNPNQYKSLTGDFLNTNQQLYSQYQQLHGGGNPTTGPNLLGGASYATPPPNWDLTSIYNQAGAGAASQVNPYYTKQLQDFQNNQAQAKALQDQQRQLNLQNLQQTQDTNLAQNELGRGRTTQDVLTQEQQLGQAADYRQQDQGQAFDQQRIAEAKAQAGAGLTGSGLGNQQALASQTAHTTQEARQGEADQQAVAHQELLKARTFEDLSNSDVLAKQANTQGQKQQAIDWDKFVQGQAQDLSSTQNNLEQQRLSRLSEVQRQLAKQQVNNMIHNLSNPQQRLAAASAYSGAF